MVNTIKRGVNLLIRGDVNKTPGKLFPKSSPEPLQKLIIYCSCTPATQKGILIDAFIFLMKIYLFLHSRIN